ncbi:hypothetical protein GU90_16290 [Saccharopolyspora rectivirgula]|jgi:hypothetical protein|uniref:Uncharacterized protein n=2 Tax=Saccharopolyspora rectivirgula TaxID=28042 RepID=A0A073B6N7_9PSEU|nr:hypothetical protein GU90_16290 [Saccharopolyspora rectivirgula]
MPAMNTAWRLKSPPEEPVQVDRDVLAMRAPLVRVCRDGRGSWAFQGPGQPPKPTQQTTLGAVVGAWPHVAALAGLGHGDAAVWSWRQHGWAAETCECGNCDPPVASDIDRGSWPAELQPHRLVSVEKAALTGQVPLTDIIDTPDGIALLGPGDHRRTADLMAPVAMANVIRRWPHTMHALRALQEGRGMRWNPEGLNWHEYRVAA